MIYLASASLVVYLYYLVLFYKGLNNDTEEKNFNRHTVSVVVAARNEEKNISQLLLALTNQTYPETHYEIIIADDSSTDRTAEIVKQFSQRFSYIKLCNVQNRDQAKSPKKNALSQAIALAENDIILLTDADCVVKDGWIEGMVAYFTDDVQMVAGFSRTKLRKWEKALPVQRFEFFDIIVIFAAAAGAIRSKKYFSCSGQNIGYCKSAFETVGGFSKIKHLLSGDDVNLMQLFRKQKFKIEFAKNPKTFVYTQPINTWKQLLNQRSRWASNLKFQISLNPEFFCYLISYPLLLLASIYLLFSNFQYGFILLVAKGVADFIFVSRAFSQFKIEKDRRSYFIFWFFLQPFYIFAVAIFGQFSLFSWHGRK